MQSRPVFMGGAALLGAVAALAAVWAPPVANPRHPAAATVPGATHLVAFTGRSMRQRGEVVTGKMDAALADLVRHAPLARPGHLLEDLHSMNPAARFRSATTSGAPLVLIDAATRGEVASLEAALVSLGLERPAVFANDVGGWLPVSRLVDAAARPELAAMNAAMPRTRAASGSVATQGDYAQGSSIVRSTWPSLTGTGVTVGVLSDSFDCFDVYARPNSGVPVHGYSGYALYGFTTSATGDEASGALPPSVDVLGEANCLDYGAPDQTPFSDEGRAMLQVVHAIAPGAKLAFYTGENSEADFAYGIGKLAAAGARVIADDLGYFDEPFYQDGIVAQAIDAVEAGGVAYFSAAGNDADASWESTAPSFATLASSGPNAGEYLVNFDTSGATTATGLPVTLAPLQPGEFVAIVVEWDQPYVTGAPGSPGATSQIDVCVTGATSAYPIIVDYDGNPVTCTGPNALGVNPVQVLIIGNPANAPGFTPQETLNVVVGLAGATPAPGRLIVSVQTDGQTNPAPIGSYATNSPSLQGHPGAAGAAAVGAAFYFLTPRCDSAVALLEPFSSLGGAPILFDASGTRLPTPVVPRQKPDFVGPDGITTTFLGFPLASTSIDGVAVGSDGLLQTPTGGCQLIPGLPNFFGTSAATPHVAGLAALMLQANPVVTPAQIYAALRQSAAPMTVSGPTPNYYSGYGFIQAVQALALLPPGAPALSLAANSVPAGQSTTLTWSATNSSSCTASGSWSGTVAASGSQSVTPAAPGSDTYTLSCSNAAGTSSPASATLMVTAADPPSSGGGGGELDGLTLGVLGALALALIRRKA